jgi:hypothetical protein
VTLRLPGATMTWVVSPTLLVTVTVTETDEPAGRDPLAGATLTLPALMAALTVNCATGPPTAVIVKDALTGFPLLDVSSRRAGLTCRYPEGREVDGDGDGVWVGDGDGDGEMVGCPAAPGLVAATGIVACGAGWAKTEAVRAGDGSGLVLTGPVLDAGPDAGPETGLDAGRDADPGPAAARPGPDACGRDPGPPAVRITAIPAVRASAAPTATAAATPGRRPPRHHRGPAVPIVFGNPAGPNVPARCATLTRCARPAGELSVQAVMTRPRSPGGGSAG